VPVIADRTRLRGAAPSPFVPVVPLVSVAFVVLMRVLQAMKLSPKVERVFFRELDV
jgi:hypothetical protein